MTQSNSIYFEVSGSGEPLVLISGLNTDHLFWTSVLPHLQTHFQVITIDNRGAGKSQVFQPECSTELMAHDVIHILDTLNIPKANIIGHSLGGCIAQQLAILHADRVNKLVLCSTQAKANPVSRILTLTTIEMMQQNVSRELIAKNVLARLYSNKMLQNEEVLNNLLKISLAKPLEESKRTYLYQVNALLHHDTSNHLKEITSPTLIIAGEEDLSTPIINSHFLANHISQSTLVSVPKMGHMLPIEEPVYFSECVIDFIKLCPSARQRNSIDLIL